MQAHRKDTLNRRLKPAVTMATSRSVSVVRPDASSLPASEARTAAVAVAAVQTAFPQEGCGGGCERSLGEGLCGRCDSFRLFGCADGGRLDSGRLFGVGRSERAALFSGCLAGMVAGG